MENSHGGCGGSAEMENRTESGEYLSSRRLASVHFELRERRVAVRDVHAVAGEEYLDQCVD
jgi:hypothetical protein